MTHSRLRCRCGTGSCRGKFGGDTTGGTFDAGGWGGRRLGRRKGGQTLTTYYNTSCFECTPFFPCLCRCRFCQEALAQERPKQPASGRVAAGSEALQRIGGPLCLRVALADRSSSSFSTISSLLHSRPSAIPPFSTAVVTAPPLTHRIHREPRRLLAYSGRPPSHPSGTPRLLYYRRGPQRLFHLPYHLATQSSTESIPSHESTMRCVVSM